MVKYARKMTFSGWWVAAMIAVLVSAWVPAVVQEVLHNRLLVQHAPETYLEVNRVSVGNSVSGDPIILSVDRVIHREFKGRWNAEVRTFPQSSVVCVGAGDVLYSTDATLPDPVTLGWWTFNPNCTGPMLPPGEYVLITTWTIKSPVIGVPDQTVMSESNSFSISAVAPETAVEAIKNQQVLQQTVRELQMQLQAIESE